jgi:MFS family permease
MNWTRVAGGLIVCAPMSEANQPRTPEAAEFPPGLRAVFAFAVFNALSFQVVLSSPMLLYAKSLQATPTSLGIITGMVSLLVILQIPAARHIARFGYKRFVYGGWGSRVAFIGVMALVPLTASFINAPSRLALMLMLLFAFNLARGISSAGWLPWISQLIPTPVRGRYLATESAWVNFASFLALLLTAFCLGSEPAPWQFAIMFSFSAAMGAISLKFLKRIPDVPVPEEERRAEAPVPWRKMASYPPFRRLLWFNIGWALAVGGVNTFVLAYLKAATPFTERGILLANSTWFIGGLASLWVLGLHLDRFGSKPILRFALLSWLGVALGWAALAGKLAAADYPVVIGLQILMGMMNALVGMANTRLAMAVVPTMGRSHFFALYSVVGSVALGVAPVLWGVAIDALGGWSATWRGFEFNQFSVFFLAVTASFVGAVILSHHLIEPTSASLETLLRELLVATPQRFWFRFWPRG